MLTFLFILFTNQNVIGHDTLYARRDTTITTENTILKGSIYNGQRIGIWVETNKSDIWLKKITYTYSSDTASVITYHYNSSIIREEYKCILDSIDNCQNVVGEYKSYYETGRPMTIGQFGENGKGEGLWIYFYENGNPSQFFFSSNGEHHGEYISYYENQKVKSKGEYQNGKKTGVWLYYDENGKRRKERYK